MSKVELAGQHQDGLCASHDGFHATVFTLEYDMFKSFNGAEVFLEICRSNEERSPRLCLSYIR